VYRCGYFPFHSFKQPDNGRFGRNVLLIVWQINESVLFGRIAFTVIQNATGTICLKNCFDGM
jgi:hypothetical protein